MQSYNPQMYMQAYNAAVQQQPLQQHAGVGGAAGGVPSGMPPLQGHAQLGGYMVSQQQLPLSSLNQDSYSYRARFGSSGGNGQFAGSGEQGLSEAPTLIGASVPNAGAMPEKLQQQMAPIETFGATLDERQLIYALVADLLHPETRETALDKLSKKRDQYDDLAVVLWHSFGVMSVLVQEITRAYHILTPEKLQGNGWTRICNALALLQCVAGHEETRSFFLGAYITLYLYPFLNTPHDNQCFQNLKLTSLGVLGALVKNDTPRVIRYLIDTDAIPVCIRIMENGNELSQTVAVFVMQKVLTDAGGREYMCESEARLRLVASVLAEMLRHLAGSTTYRHLKHIIRCYEKLSLHPAGRIILRQMLPKELRDASFSEVLKEDTGTKQVLAQLLLNLSDNVVG